MAGSDMTSVREWGGRLPVALVFPEEEPLALATLGWQSVYKELGLGKGFYVERYFWDRKTGRAVSPDSDKRLRDFSLICFSLNFEGDLINLIQILKAEDIPVSSSERSDWPLIMAGGPIAFLNPYPVAPSLDFLFVGESEGIFSRTAAVIRDMALDGCSSGDVLKSIKSHPGIMIPADSPRVTRQFATHEPGVLATPCHSAFVSGSSVFRDSFLIEINRGCAYGCRFCAAGFIYRPPRRASLDQVKKLVEQEKPVKVGLVGTALTDWKDLLEFLVWLSEKKIKFSLSSLRADGLSREFLSFLRHCGTRTLTLAVEGLSPRLRRAMNKHFSEDMFFRAVEYMSELRFNTLKLYFILGLPGEQDSDFDSLKDFLKKLELARKSGMGNRKKGLDLISISASMFVPKPWTPLQWASMDSEENFLKKVKLFKAACAGYGGLKFQAERPFPARIQGLLSRGDSRVHELIVLAAQNQGNWKKALKAWSGKIEDYVDKTYPLDTEFVWDSIDMGIEKKYLKREWQQYHAARLTPPCPDDPCHKCRRCRMNHQVA